MSYILEALVQAQLERQCHGVPSLYTAQTLPRRRPTPRRRWPPVVAGIAGLSGLLAIAWMQPWYRDAPGDSTPIISSASVAASPETAKPAVVSLARPEPAPNPPMQQLQSAVPEAGTIGVQPGDVRRKPVRKARKARIRAPVAKVAALPGARLYSIGELPAELQKVARRISIAGFAHSDNPKERMAIINDRALREGEALSGGLRVERIAGDGVIFSLKGYRFRKGRT